MDNVNGPTLYSKLRELLPVLPSGVSPEVLNKFCENDSAQPFLKWFHDNISCNNVLPDENKRLREHVQKNGTWLQGQELDLALAEATKDCPELLNLIDAEYSNSNQFLTDYGMEKELYDSDFENLQTIEDSLRKLKECEEQIDNELDKEINTVKQEEIKLNLIYNNCITVLEDFDSCHRQFFKAIELLADTYINAVQKKGEPCIWTQMPIELYIKQLETYNEYLISYTKRQFSVSQKDENEIDTDTTNFMNESGENEKLRELLNCQKNLFTSKIEEITAKMEDVASKSLLNYVIDIYNDGNLKAPSTSILARAEIAELTKNRDFLEENINLLKERQLVDSVLQFSKIKVIKFLEEEAEARMQRRQGRLFRLEKLCTFAKEHGHAFSTLLCMLFELQIHRINEIIQFVLDARHYLSIEYSLSCIRNDSMKKLQNEYATTLASSKDQNAFCHAFMEIAAIDDVQQEDVQASVQYYDDLKNDNTNKLKILLDEQLTKAIDSSKSLETMVLDLYNQETTNGKTVSFKAVPTHIQDEIDTILKKVEKLETNVEAMRNKLKIIIKETSTPNLKREKLLLWQSFLADPEALKIRCKELENLRDQSVF